MKSKKPKKKLTPLEKMFEFHKPSCTVHVWSGDRHCSCGRDEAEKQYKKLMEMVKALTLFDMEPQP